RWECGKKITERLGTRHNRSRQREFWAFPEGLDLEWSRLLPRKKERSSLILPRHLHPEADSGRCDGMGHSCPCKSATRLARDCDWPADTHARPMTLGPHPRATPLRPNSPRRAIC